MSDVKLEKHRNHRQRKVAHFLLTANLDKSPPNDALKQVYGDLDVSVDMFAPPLAEYSSESTFVSYRYRWLLRNLLNPSWRRYCAFSCTSEDPIVIAGLLALIWRKPLIFLSDEIKSGVYRGDRSKIWKRTCQWLMRRAAVTIVNDQARVELQRNYAKLGDNANILVYPGCFLNPPVAADRNSLHSEWNVNEGQSVLCFSGGCNLSAGIDWALESLSEKPNVKMVVQPLSINDLNLYLLGKHRNANQIFIQQHRMSWTESWTSMGGADVGIAIYTNPVDQFQLMGISSNRLCMFLAMGVPVIVNKQPSFQFVEDYNCGFMVETSEEFAEALHKLLENNEEMRANALRCTKEYIDTKGKFQLLKHEIERVLSK